MAEHGRVTHVALHPLKSAHAATVDGQVPDRLTVGPTGFEAHEVRDRDFVLAYGDRMNAAFVSQRGWGPHNRSVQFPQDRRLASLAVDIRPDHLAFTAPGFGSFALPTQLLEGQPWNINIFSKEFPGVDQGPEAAAFFSRLLGEGKESDRPLRLIRADRSRPRLLPERYQRFDASNQVSGADGMPFLLTNEASLAALHRTKGLEIGAVAMNRYRPNIVVGGLPAWFEDYAEFIWFGTVGAYAVKACSRCPIPNTDQETGEYDGASTRILGSRAGEISTGEKGVFFGQNLNHVYEPGRTIGVNDKVQVAAWLSLPNVTLRSN